MAKLIQTWRCDVCSDEFTEECGALRCEYSHGPATIEGYTVMEEDKGRYPRGIVVTFTDGTAAYYGFEEFLNKE